MSIRSGARCDVMWTLGGNSAICNLFSFCSWCWSHTTHAERHTREGEREQNASVGERQSSLEHEVLCFVLMQSRALFATGLQCTIWNGLLLYFVFNLGGS